MNILPMARFWVYLTLCQGRIRWLDFSCMDQVEGDRCCFNGKVG